MPRVRPFSTWISMDFPWHTTGNEGRLFSPEGTLMKLHRKLLLSAATIGLPALLWATPHRSAFPEAVPSGFAVSQVATGISKPTAMTFAPDGRIFVSEKEGSIRVIKNGSLLATPFLTLTVDSAGEHGLIGVAFDPAFATNRFVYVYYVATTPAVHSRISRFTADGDIAAAGETVLFDFDNIGSSTFHVAGALAFGPDGKLYAAVGDNAGVPFSDNAQRLTNTFGKIFRINTDGTIPTDNPFYSTATGKYRAIWAYGLRNPFTFSFQPGTGRMFINDVGGLAWEEINEGRAGANYGWPTTEGPTTDPRFTAPLFAYGHGTASDDSLGCAITGGTFYNPATMNFPSQFRGKYFFVDYCRNWMRVFDPATGTASQFASAFSSNPLVATTGPDGSLYYLSEWLNGVYKITYTASLAPQIGTHPASQTVATGDSATFSVEVSGEPPFQYRWQRDGTDIPGANTSSYTLANVTSADDGARFRCVVSSDYGSQTSNEATLTVLDTHSPVPSIDYPESGTLYSSGDRIYYGGSAEDQEDGELSASAFTWWIDFHHNVHTHPFLGPITGKTAGYFTTPVSGEPDWNTWFRIYLKVTDSDGRSTTTYREVFNRKSIFSLRTNPPGLKVMIDGKEVATPLDVTGVVGFSRELGVVSPQTLGGVSYVFDSWSDQKPATHVIKTGVSKRVYTANFKPASSARSGKLVASPNPALVCDGSRAGITTLSWSSAGVTNVEVRINRPDGNLLGKGGMNGSASTKKWVGDNSTFYLQDVSNGLPLTQENTLATVTVNLTTYGCDVMGRPMLDIP